MTMNRYIAFEPRIRFRKLNSVEYMILDGYLHEYKIKHESRGRDDINPRNWVSYWGGLIFNGTYCLTVGFDVTYLSNHGYFDGCENMAANYIKLKELEKVLDEMADKLNELLEERS